MSPRLSRLGIGDWLIGPASLLLLVVLFAFPWFAVSGNFAAQAAAAGVPVSANGWNTFTAIGPLSVIVAGLGLATWVVQLCRPTPALGILTTIVLAPVALIDLVWLIVRVLIFPPQQQVGLGATGNDLTSRPAAYVAVVLSLLIFLGAVASLRREGIDPADAPSRIETFPLA